jgi:hypothetical protein
MARPQWRAPENQPLNIAETHIVELATTPRAIIASFGMAILLGMGAMTALTFEETAGLAEPDVKPVSEAAKPVAAPPSIPDSKITAEGTTQIAQAQDPAGKPPPQAVSVTPRLPVPTPVTLVKIPQPTATAVSPKAEISGLNHNDPRWARPGLPEQPVAAAVAPAHDASANTSGILAFAGPPAKTDVASQAATRFQSPGDPVITAAIPKPAVERPAPLPVAAVAPEDPKPTRQGRIRTAVNMRTGPADEAKVIGVVPANATVNLVRCTSWCEIVFKNRRGWIYKGFVR